MSEENKAKPKTNEPREELSSRGVFPFGKEFDLEKEKARKHRLMEAKRKSKDDIAMLIVAAILFIIASILLFLSFRYNTKKERVFTPTSLSFFISMILYGFTVFLSIFGGIRLFLHKKAIRESK